MGPSCVKTSSAHALVLNQPRDDRRRCRGQSVPPRAPGQRAPPRQTSALGCRTRRGMCTAARARGHRRARLLDLEARRRIQCQSCKVRSLNLAAMAGRASAATEARAALAARAAAGTSVGVWAAAARVSTAAGGVSATVAGACASTAARGAGHNLQLVDLRGLDGSALSLRCGRGQDQCGCSCCWRSHQGLAWAHMRAALEGEEDDGKIEERGGK